MDRLQTLKATLPNFPDEVLGEWLAPLLGRREWPPRTDSAGGIVDDWTEILLHKPLDYWQRVTWRQEDLPLAWDTLSTDSVPFVRRYLCAFLMGDAYALSNVPTDGSRRFGNALRYVKEHGVMPGRIAVLVDRDRLLIADGYHRVAAYLAYQEMLRNPPDGKVPDGFAEIRSLQPMWVVRAWAPNDGLKQAARGRSGGVALRHTRAAA